MQRANRKEWSLLQPGWREAPQDRRNCLNPVAYTGLEYAQSFNNIVLDRRSKKIKKTNHLEQSWQSRAYHSRFSRLQVIFEQFAPSRAGLGGVRPNHSANQAHPFLRREPRERRGSPVTTYQRAASSRHTSGCAAACVEHSHATWSSSLDRGAISAKVIGGIVRFTSLLDERSSHTYRERSAIE